MDRFLHIATKLTWLSESLGSLGKSKKVATPTSVEGRKSPCGPEGSGTDTQLEQREEQRVTELPCRGLAEAQTQAGLQCNDRYFSLLSCAEPVCPEASRTGEPDALGPEGYYFRFYW